MRQVTKFKNRKILFMKALSENLYFRNLDNDAGVFHHLLDAAEEAEVTEACWPTTSCARARAAHRRGLDRRIEAWFDPLEGAPRLRGRRRYAQVAGVRTHCRGRERP